MKLKSKIAIMEKNQNEAVDNEAKLFKLYDQGIINVYDDLISNEMDKIFSLKLIIHTAALLCYKVYMLFAFNKPIICIFGSNNELISFYLNK